MGLLLLVLAFVAVLAVVGAITGGSVNGQAQNENSKRPNDDSVSHMSMFGTVKTAEDIKRENSMKLAELEKLRKAHLLNIRAVNERCIAEDGVPYMYEREALEEFDDRHFKEYHELGVLPPSYRDGSRKRKVLYR